MKKVEPNLPVDVIDKYYLVEDSSGVLRCSCGRELIKMDEETYRCLGGYPVYRIDDGSVVIDRFGRLMIKKEEEHSENDKK
jgi:hypothetical protein